MQVIRLSPVTKKILCFKIAFKNNTFNTVFKYSEVGKKVERGNEKRLIQLTGEIWEKASQCQNLCLMFLFWLLVYQNSHSCLCGFSITTLPGRDVSFKAQLCLLLHYNTASVEGSSATDIGGKSDGNHVKSQGQDSHQAQRPQKY